MVHIWRLLIQQPIQNTSSMHINVNFELKDPNFTSEENMFKDVSDKPLIPARKAQITNANYKRHGMKLMILGNDEPYNNEFKKDESKNAKEMKKISKDAQDQDNDDHGGGH